MEILTILYLLKILWMGFQLYQYKRNQEKEKTLIEKFDDINQRLKSLENQIKKLNS